MEFSSRMSMEVIAVPVEITAFSFVSVINRTPVYFIYKQIGLLVVFMLLLLHVLPAQDKSNAKFGRITPADFDFALQKFDSGANAIIMADIGSTRFEGNSNGFFTLIYTKYLRVKIMNKNGFEIGNHRIKLYNDNEGGIEKLYSLKGSTYNLENGIVKETKLDDHSVYSEKFSKYITIKKLSLPALKEGSIFELEYVIKSPFEVHLRSWDFQGAYPLLWSEYEVFNAPPYHYVMSMTGNQDFYVDTVRLITQDFMIRVNNGTGAVDAYTLSGNTIDRRWVKKNVPALQEEPFTTTLDNYNSGVTFQLHYFQWPEGERHEYMNDWYKTSKTLLGEEDFGTDLNRDNGWISDELKSILPATLSEQEKTYRIYCFVRDNIKATGTTGLYIHDDLKDVFKKRAGSTAEINLLLTAMLRKASVNADPLILSTRENGFASPEYPMMNQYNYVICMVHLETKDIPLDASQPYSGFGRLPESCYNGYGHIINEEKPFAVLFSADSMMETSLTNVFISNDEKGRPSGSFTTTFGKAASYNEREKIKIGSLKEYEKKIQQDNSSDLTVQQLGIDSLNNFDMPLTVHYDFELKNFSLAEILYFNPMLNEGYKSNLFTSMERQYPVEIPYKINETYLLTMDIPAGYQVDELPNSIKVKLNDADGFFEYLIQKGDHEVQMRVRLSLNKAFFSVDEYASLRNFFFFLVKKEREQFVFRKIK